MYGSRNIPRTEDYFERSVRPRTSGKRLRISPASRHRQDFGTSILLNIQPLVVYPLHPSRLPDEGLDTGQVQPHGMANAPSTDGPTGRGKWQFGWWN